MDTTKVTRTLTPAGFAPAGKPGNVNQVRRRVTAVILRVSASWLACGLAAMGMAHAQAPTWAETVLYNFANIAPKGQYPAAGVIRDSAGNLYGTTEGGGKGYGVVYKLDAAGVETVLYSFTGGADGAFPYAGVIRDSAGNLYGTTSNGGDLGVVCEFESGCGVVFKLDPSGQETVLYAFTGGADGGYPDVGVIRDSVVNLFGTTNIGGTSGWGVVFRVNPSGQETVLYSFTGGADGGSPGPVISDSAGNLYGITYGGGTAVGYAGYGVVFKLDPARQETVLYTFTGGADGAIPNGLIRNSAGNFYGTTYEGGPANAGVVFKLDPVGQQTLLYSFTGGADGSNPYAGLIPDSAGNLYGTTYSGGTSGYGVVFKLDPAGQETVLHSFTGGADGGNPEAGVIRDSAGNLYGTTFYGGVTSGYGVVFKLDTTGQETAYAFPTSLGGTYPQTGVVRDPAGNLYGTASEGGTPGAGVLFKLNPDGRETVLYKLHGPGRWGFT
jgi:uncharacterized repeat protein (TIGR03803 family)